MRARPVTCLLAAALLFCLEARSEEIESTCVSCHAEEEEAELSVPVEEWRGSVHAAVEVSCDACHGGDPFEEDEEMSMDEEHALFVGVPVWSEEAEFCGSCHEAILETYSQSLLASGIPEHEEVAVCTTCHMYSGHDIEPADAREILTSERCSECHPAAGALVWRNLLQELGGQLDSVHARMVPIRSAVDTSILDRELSAIDEHVVAIAHTYDLDAIAARTALTRERLAGVGPVVGELAAEARFRRRLGLGVVISLLVASVAAARLGGGARRGGSG